MNAKLYTVIFAAYIVLVSINSCKPNNTNSTIEPLELQLTPTNVSAYGLSDGSIDLTVSGGANPYQYQWSNGMTTEDISNLNLGVYSVIVTDAEQETVSDTTIITEPEKTYFSKSVQTLGNTRTFGLDIGDIDLDGDNDIVIANYAGQSVLWLNNGNGVFAQSQTFNVSEVHDAKFADFNGDTYPDIILLGMASYSKIFFNNQDGSFNVSNQNIGSPNDNPNYVYTGDIDGDDDIDMLIYNYGEPNGLWLNNGSGEFTKTLADFGGDDAKGFEFTDFNGDSFLDLFVNIRANPNQIWLNDGTGNFINSNHSFGNGGDYTHCVDFDKDGDMDIAITNAGFGVTIWLNQNNTGTFVSGPSITEGANHCRLIDVDLDNDFDLITTDAVNGNKLWLNNGVGSFESLGQAFGDKQTLSIECDDIDGDGDIDVMLGQLEGTGGNSIYFNQAIK